LDFFPCSSSGTKIPALLGPLERTDLSHRPSDGG
jgi:hypothetical protein